MVNRQVNQLVNRSLVYTKSQEGRFVEEADVEGCCKLVCFWHELGYLAYMLNIGLQSEETPCVDDECHSPEPITGA